MREIIIEQINPPFGIRAEVYNDKVRVVMKSQTGELNCVDLTAPVAKLFLADLRAVVKAQAEQA